MAEVRDWIPVTCSTDIEELKIRVFHTATSVVSSKQKEIHLRVFLSRTGWILRVNDFPIPASYYYAILKEKNASWIKHIPIVRRSLIQCITPAADFQASRCQETRIIERTLNGQKCFFELAWVVSSSSNARARMHLNFRKMWVNRSKISLFISRCSVFQKNSQLASMSVLGKVYNIFGF